MKANDFLRSPTNAAACSGNSKERKPPPSGARPNLLRFYQLPRLPTAEAVKMASHTSLRLFVSQWSDRFRRAKCAAPRVMQDSTMNGVRRWLPPMTIARMSAFLILPPKATGQQTANSCQSALRVMSAVEDAFATAQMRTSPPTTLEVAVSPIVAVCLPSVERPLPPPIRSSSRASVRRGSANPCRRR